MQISSQSKNDYNIKKERKMNRTESDYEENGHLDHRSKPA